MFIFIDCLLCFRFIISIIVIKVVFVDEIEWMYYFDGGNNVFIN